MKKNGKKMLKVGFEPTPFRNRAWIYRLRPLGHFNFLNSFNYPPLFHIYTLLFSSLKFILFTIFFKKTIFCWFFNVFSFSSCKILLSFKVFDDQSNLSEKLTISFSSKGNSTKKKTHLKFLRVYKVRI